MVPHKVHSAFKAFPEISMERSMAHAFVTTSFFYFLSLFLALYLAQQHLSGRPGAAATTAAAAAAAAASPLSLLSLSSFSLLYGKFVV